MDRKKILIVALVAFAVIGLIVGLVLTKNKHTGGNNKPSGPTCKNQYETCLSSGDCCPPYSCAKGTCQKLVISKPIYAFQLESDGMYLGLNEQARTIGLVSKSDVWSSWWSWDGSILRFIDAGKIYEVPPPVDKGVVQLTDSQVEEGSAISIAEDIASITSNDGRYCTIENNGSLIWTKCVDNPSGRSQQFKIEIVSNCTQPGENCGSSMECCLSGDCQDGKCVICKETDKPSTCSEGSKPVCNNYTGTWSCVSNCDPSKKPTTQCPDTQHVACILQCPDGQAETCKDSEKVWKWGCITDCTGTRPDTCAQSSCQYDADTKTYEYKCDMTCDNGMHHIDPPPIPSGCVVQSVCPGNEVNKLCLKCGDDFKKMYYSCAKGDWVTEDFCDPSNVPTCSTSEQPQCIELAQFACGGKEGRGWVCPSTPGNWCNFASINNLAPKTACQDGSTSCDTTYYETTDGRPVYPTISYNNCSNPTLNTFPTDQNYAQNPKGFVNVTSDKTYLYSSDKEATIDGNTMFYSDNHVYYKPGHTQKLDPPYCLMYPESSCVNGTVQIEQANQLSGYANFSTKDPRETDFNNPPKPATLPNVGKCQCNSGYLGFFCGHTQEQANAYCNNNGKGVTSDDPDNPIACQCNPNTIGDQCQISPASCNNVGIPYGTVDNHGCVCNPSMARGATCADAVELPSITYYTGKNQTGTPTTVNLDGPDRVMSSTAGWGSNKPINVLLKPLTTGEQIVNVSWDTDNCKGMSWNQQSLVVNFGSWKELYLNCLEQKYEGGARPTNGCVSIKITPTSSNTYTISDLTTFVKQQFPDYFSVSPDECIERHVNITLGTTPVVASSDYDIMGVAPEGSCAWAGGTKNSWTLGSVSLKPGVPGKTCAEVCGDFLLGNSQCFTGWDKASNSHVECTEPADLCMCGGTAQSPGSCSCVCQPGTYGGVPKITANNCKNGTNPKPGLMTCFGAGSTCSCSCV